MDEHESANSVKRLLETSKPLYQEAFTNLEVIVASIKELKGKDFMPDVTWEILFEYINGEMDIDECIRLLNGGVQ